MLKKVLPSISAIIPVFNEEDNLKRLFNSLKSQTYPRNKIEYIVVNDGSNDNSEKLARKFGARILNVKTHDIELNKGIGMHAAKNDLVYWFDADMEVCCNNFFELLANPLLEDKKIIGSFTKEFSIETKPRVKSSLLRFIAHHPLMQDPLYAFFSPSIASTVIEKREKYFLCNFTPGKIPAMGRILYRRKELLKTVVGKDKSFIDLESIEIVARAGHQLFAYVPLAKIRHYHAENLKLLIIKRLRNLERDYLPNLNHKYYLWFDPKKRKDLLKIFFWVAYANLFIPELIRGVLRTIKHRDPAFLWHPIVAMTTTDAIVWGFVSRPQGRGFVVKLIKNLLSKI